jgi:hypothetical protein
MAASALEAQSRPRPDHVPVFRTGTVPMTRTIRVPRTDHHGVLAAIEFPLR